MMESKFIFVVTLFIVSTASMSKYSIKAIELPEVINKTVSKVSSLFKNRFQTPETSQQARSSFLLVLPAELSNLTNSIKELEFNLLKLNSDVLFGVNNTALIDEQQKSSSLNNQADILEYEDRESRSSQSRGDLRSFKASNQHHRDSRSIKLFGPLWNKKPGPLYLVNGTVCRFITNAQPICTTLQTKGLIAGDGGAGVTIRPTNQNGQSTQAPLNNNDAPAG